MKPQHLIPYLKNLDRKAKQISLELCTNRNIDISRVKQIGAAFCSVTWLDNKVPNLEEHPTIKLSHELIKNGINVLIHLPGRIYDRQQMLQILNIIKEIGVKNILAVQGERSLGESKNDFPYASSLVEFIKQIFNDYFCIGVTGYPSGHPRSSSIEEDLVNLKKKVDAGASFIITQAIFDISTFYAFQENCNSLGIKVPILPGLFVINTYPSLINMIKFCKLHLPDDIMKFMEENKDKEEIIEEYGISLVLTTVKNLFSNDDIPLKCVHIFTLNNLNTLQNVLDKI